MVEFLKKVYVVDNVDNCYFGSLGEDYYLDFKHITKEFLSNYTHIILLAGHSCPSMCVNEFKSCWKNNVENFVTLLDRKSPDQVLIYASTAAIYMNSSTIRPFNEFDDVGAPCDVYTLSKKTIEEIAKFYPNTVGLRFGTAAGHSKNFRQENLVNSLSVNAYRTGNIALSNPNLMRSILGLNDLCRAIQVILEQGIKNPIYNLVSFTGSILDIGLQIQEITNCALTINDSMTTSYSFNCSSALFCTDYEFNFKDTSQSLYSDIVENLDKVVINVPRSILQYG